LRETAHSLRRSGGSSGIAAKRRSPDGTTSSGTMETPTPSRTIARIS
jgi:hypothetical protein